MLNIESNLLTKFKVSWPADVKAANTVKKWCEIIFLQKKFLSQKMGVDFYTDLHLTEIQDQSQVIVTRWIDPAESSFYCVSGPALYSLFPWWKNMEKKFGQEGLHPWLNFPCVLLSKARLPKHADIGRPTALNYPVFDKDPMNGYFWLSENSEDSEYIASYKYQPNQMILLNTTRVHGGLPEKPEDVEKFRAIFNMGFKEEYEVCRRIIERMNLESLFSE